MMKVLVVEDEPPIKKWIERVIGTTEGFAVVEGNAVNGQEAMRICRQTRPDIVFTDIRMPVMDGVQLVKQLKTEFPEIRCVILSNYGEYAIVRETLRDGAYDYLLKLEMEEKDIGEVLQKLEHMILERRKNQTVLRGEILRKLICTNTEDQENLSRLKTHAGLELRGRQMAVLAMRRSDGKKLENLMPDPGSGWIFCGFSGYGCMVMCRSTPLSIEQMKEEAERQIQYAVSAAGVSLDCGLGRSLIYEEQKDLYESYVQAVNRMEQAAFYRPGEGKLLSDDREETALWNHTVSQLWRDISRYPLECGMDVLVERMSRLIGQLPRFTGLPQEDLKKDLIRLILTLMSKITCLKEESEKQKELQNSIWEARDVKRLTAYLSGFSELAEHIGSIPPHVSEPVKKALDYILENYRRDITRSDVADYVHLNGEYFSERFKKEMGKGFSEYLTEKRMDYACYLLTETDCLIMEAAEQSGYHDVGHFSRTFMKWKGNSPRDYRRLHRQGNTGREEKPEQKEERTGGEQCL